MRKLMLCFACCGAVVSALLGQGSKPVAASAEKPLYENDFDKAEVGKVPDEFLVLDGAFVVKSEGTNKFLELPGAPLDTFGLLFGPTFDPKQDSGVVVTARFEGAARGRRFPTFALGANGQGGFRLQVSPAKDSLELYKGESEVIASIPFKWESGAWTVLRLQLQRLKDGEWKVEGKAWKQKEKEPAAWTISHLEKGDLLAGRASIWGSPFSGTPIRFDDLRITRP